MKIAVAVAAIAAGFIICAAPAGADTSAQDRQFLSALESIGWTITNPDLLIEQGHMVCDEGLAHGVSWQEIHAVQMSRGYSQRDSSSLIKTAISTYCPNRSDVIADMERDLSSGTAANRDDSFVVKLKRMGISIDKDTALDMARAACMAPATKGVPWYNAVQAMQASHPEYKFTTVGSVMAHALLAFCPERLS